MPVKKDEKIVHIHSWRQNPLLTHLDCLNGCGYIRIPQEEYEKRIKEWDSYYKKIETTPAYLDFMEMRKHWRNRKESVHKEAIEEIHTKVMTRMKDTGETDEYRGKIYEHETTLEKPNFPDPSTWSKYIVS